MRPSLALIEGGGCLKPILSDRRRFIRWCPVTTRRGLAIFVIFAVTTTTAVYLANQRFPLFRFVQTSGTEKHAKGVASSASLSARSADTGMGEVLFAKRGSDFCRRIGFDNRTGTYCEAHEIFAAKSAFNLLKKLAAKVALNHYVRPFSNSGKKCPGAVRVHANDGQLYCSHACAEDGERERPNRIERVASASILP